MIYMACSFNNYVAALSRIIIERDCLYTCPHNSNAQFLEVQITVKEFRDGIEFI